MTLTQLGSVKPAAAELRSAIAAVAAGEGVALTLAHRVVDEVRRRSLVRLDVPGTPVLELRAPSLGAGVPADLALQRFPTRRDATQVISAGRGGGSAPGRPKKVHLTLWHSRGRERGRVELRH